MSRRRRNRGRTALLLTVLVAATGAVPAAASAADSRTLFGVDPEAGQLTPGDLAWMDAGQVGSVRFILNWQEVQPNPGDAFNWSRIDQEIETLALHKIVPLPQLFGDPSLVTQTGNSAVMNRWLFFVAAAVNRYKAGSPFWQQFKEDHPNATPLPPSVWQVYNEQNIPEFWPGGPSPNKYAVLLHASALAIRGSDPSAKIMLGGMHGQNNMNGTPSWTFLKNLYEYPGAAADFDIVAIHPYQPDLSGIANEISMVRNVMNSKGDQQAQIWITEMGWSSKLDPANTWWWEQTPEGQAKMLDSAWRMLLYAKSYWNIGGIYWYTWRDPTTDVCNFCNSAGLLEKNYFPKPSYGAFRQLARANTP